MNNNNLIYRIELIEGVDIDVLCNSLKALKDEYLRFTKNTKSLVVKEVRKGSGIFEFTEVVILSTLLFVENSNTILQFVEHLAAVKDVILKKKEKLPNDVKLIPATIDNVNSILSPVNYGNNNKVNIEVNQLTIINIEKDDYAEFAKNSKQILKEVKQENKSLNKDYICKKVLFKWIQTNFDNNKIGNIGVIKKIQENPVKVIFADDNSKTKTEMTTSMHGVDWQKIKYIVDVEVIFDEDRIVAYKILKNYPDDSIIENNSNLKLL